MEKQIKELKVNRKQDDHWTENQRSGRSTSPNQQPFNRKDSYNERRSPPPIQRHQGGNRRSSSPRSWRDNRNYKDGNTDVKTNSNSSLNY